jgi:CheY-like chemotaxis protein
MLFRYLQLILLPILSFAKDFSDTESVGINISIFLLIITIIFVTYKTFIFYKSKETSDNISKKTKEIVETSFNKSHELLNEDKTFIEFLKTNHLTNISKNETFRVQNLLNEVYGLTEPLIQKNNIEFIYDVDSSIPIELVGDSLLIEQTLYNLLSEIIILSPNATLTVRFEKENQSNILVIQVINSKNILLDNISSLETIHTLLKQINATLSVQNNIYTLHLPFLSSSLYHESYYALPDTVLGQKVLLIEDNTQTAKIISNIFHHFGLEVTTKLSSTLTNIHNFEVYDIVIVDAKLLTPILLRHFEEIKEEQSLHIISLETLYGQRDRRFKPNSLIDKYLYKPLSTGMIFGFLYEIYVMQENNPIPSHEKPKGKDKYSEIVFIEEKENITPESFQDFNLIHILVVEDNKINQKIIQSVLQKSKIQITIANNGQEALNQLKEHPTIDIILMDINMPIMDGYQATKKIRENSSFSSLPIVIVSGLGFRNEIEQMYLAGANAHLTKPFKIGQLYNAFNMFLNTRKEEVNSNERYNSQYIEDINILDIQKGVASVQNILAYRDSLRETLVMLKSSDEKIKESIIKKDFMELYVYCNRILIDSQYIGATNLTQVLNEILILLNQKEEVLLQSYIILYRDAWIKTKRNIELYLKSVNSY